MTFRQAPSKGPLLERDRRIVPAVGAKAEAMTPKTPHAIEARP